MIQHLDHVLEEDVHLVFAANVALPLVEPVRGEVVHARGEELVPRDPSFLQVLRGDLAVFPVRDDDDDDRVAGIDRGTA